MTTKDKALELLDLLLAEYPLAFSDDRERIRPLEINIHLQLYDWAKSKGYSGTALRMVLRRYASRTSYLYALAERREQISLDGHDRGRPSREHAQHARQQLLERKKAKRLKAMSTMGDSTPKLKLAGICPKLTLKERAVA